MKAISYTSSATRQLRKLPAEIRERVIDKLKRYASSGAGDVKALVGQPGARLRVGDYRVVFVETADAISVRAVGHRSDVYE
jgi:mRNA interferase RelE/StbE